MYDDIEFRSVIRFLLLRKIPKKEIITQLQEAYGSDAPCKATVYNWCREFSSGRTSVFDQQRTGRPAEIGDQKTNQLKKIIEEHRKATQTELSQMLNVSKITVQRLMGQLGIRKLCSRFVPRFLTAEMMDQRLLACQRNLDVMQEVGDRFLSNIVTEDETPLSLFLPYSRRESKEWKFPEEKPTNALRSGTSHRKCLMLSIFWDSTGVIKMDFTTGNINSEYYVGLLRDTRRLRRKPHNQQLFLLHDNAPIHTSGQTQQAIQNLGFSQLNQPPYSPDLAPSDFYLFHHLKKHLRGQRFDTKEELRENVQQFFHQQHPDFFKTGFKTMVDRWRKCVAANGSYIEK